jgi:DNA-binding NtrC family response regulator
LKKTRRIEITAFRRQVTIYSGDEHWKNANDLSPSRDESRPNTDGTDRLTVELGVGCDAALNAARAGELALLAEALLESEGQTSVAARRLSLSQSGFHSKLRSLGLSMRNLITDLNLFSDHRAATKRVEEKQATCSSRK